jgi:hypothetical protein
MNKIKFAEGIDFYFPSQKAPEWLVGKITVNPEVFTEFIKEQKVIKTRVSFNICRSKKNPDKVYLSVDEYVPKDPEEEVDDESTSFF